MITCIGVGVFAGYHGRPELTAEVLIEVNGEQCYRTGDFGRWDTKCEQLIFVGRRDFQVKLRGQRIELSAIESVLMRSSSDVANCIVTKEESADQSHLAAYIKTRNLKEESNLKEEMMKLCKLVVSYPQTWFLQSGISLPSTL